MKIGLAQRKGSPVILVKVSTEGNCVFLKTLSTINLLVNINIKILFFFFSFCVKGKKGSDELKGVSYSEVRLPGFKSQTLYLPN